MFDQWLSADRIDSKLARQLGCHLSAEQIDVLRKQFKNRHGHEVAVACGGMMAPSINFERLQAGRPVLQQCPYCQQQTVPSVSHIFWHCPHFDHARSLPAPVDELQQRLGWSVDGNHQRFGGPCPFKAAAGARFGTAGGLRDVAWVVRWALMHIMLRGFGLSVMVAAWCANIYVYIYII